MENQPKTPWWEPALKLFFELSGWILAPILVAFFLGRFLDDRFGTAPWIFLATLALAFLISNIAIVKKSSATMKALELNTKKNESGIDGNKHQKH